MRIEKSLIAALFSLILFGHSTAAHAIPSFARQTGMECSSCHVGSFGPQLTPFGRDFKLNGYVMGEVKNKLQNFAGMVYGGFEHTQKDMRKGVELTGKQERFKENNNLTLDQASLFYGGALASKLGIFSQVTYDGIEKAVSWDNVDLRYADNATVGNENFVYGVTLNNNPSVQDLWQTAPAWTFPYLSSGLAPAPDAEPYIASLGQTVAGLGAYGMWDGLLYGELSGYNTLSDSFQRTVGMTDVRTSDHLDGTAPYWRLALQHDFGQQYVSLGTFGMYSKRFPGNVRSSGTDNMTDTALDATWQYTTENGKHNVSLYGSAIHEHQSLHATSVLSGSNPSDTLNTYRLTSSYYFEAVSGATLTRFVTKGSTDAALYDSGRPDSAGWTVQADYSPFGTEKSFAWPYFTPRFFAQYTAYDKFNGLSKNFDGTGRDAADNNTLYAGIWAAF